MQIFTSAVCRLLFITGENESLMVVTVFKKCFVADSLLYQIALLNSLKLLFFREIYVYIYLYTYLYTV